MSDKRIVTRRRFVQGAAVAAAAPMIAPRSVLGQARPAPSNRITVGFIGIGNMGGGHYGGMLRNGEVQIVAVCDVRQQVRDRCKQQAEQAYGQDMASGKYKGCDTYKDFREMLARPDIDAVLIATPEHWHAIMVIEAAKAGKDIYCEKPLSHTIREAQAMTDAVRRYGRVFQTGSQQRSSREFRQACEYVRSGRIGKVQSVHVAVGGTSNWAYLPEQPVPEGLDWDMWQGPAMWAPYNAERASGSYSGGWRLIRDYSGGMMCDWGAHHIDIAQWGLGMDQSGPVKAIPPGKEYPVLTYKYANGVPCYHMHGAGAREIKVPTGRGVNGVLFVGEKGWVEVNRGYLRTNPEDIMKEPLSPGEVHLYDSSGHTSDWIECIKTRQRPICDVAVGASTITMCHLGNIAYWLNRSFKWDPAKREIVGDAEAAALVELPMRAPWRL